MSRSGESDGLPGGFLGNLLVQSYLHIDGVTKAAGSSSGQINYTFSAPDAQFDYLAKNQTVTLTYTVRLNDGDGGITTQTLAVTVTGTNDRPVFVAGDARFGLENLNTTGSSALETFNGVLAFADADRDDVGHTATVTGFNATGTTAGLNNADVDHALLIGAVTKTANSIAGTVAWSFSAQDKAFDYLAAGETVTLAYQITLDDNEGDSNSTDTTTIYVTIVGTNDRPVITTGDQTRGLTEYALSTGGAALQAAGGTFDFTDVDLTDVHTTGASLTSAVWSGNGTIPSATQAAIANALSTSITNDSTGTGTGKIDWTFGLADQYVDFLAKGETLTLTYTVTLKDDSGTGNNAALTKTVTISITGTNDVPVITTQFGDSDHAFLTETNSGLMTQGTLTATDVDISDVLHASVISVNASGAGIDHIISHADLASFLVLGTNPIDSNSTTSGTIFWTFDSKSEAFDFLPSGWESVINYTIRVEDGQGGYDDHVVQIKIRHQRCAGNQRRHIADSYRQQRF